MYLIRTNIKGVLVDFVSQEVDAGHVFSSGQRNAIFDRTTGCPS